MQQQDASLEADPRHRGKVIWFQSTKGFGFIRPDDSVVSAGKDLFVHFHYVVQRGFKTLTAGDVVEFAVGQNHEGPCAKDVKVLEHSIEGDDA